MTTRRLCFPLHEAEEGMILAVPAVIPEHGVVTLRLPAGHVLTESNLRQLAVRHAEFVCVEVEDARSPEEREEEWKAHEARLHHVFRHADLEQPMTSALFSALLAFRKG